MWSCWPWLPLVLKCWQTSLSFFCKTNVLRGNVPSLTALQFRKHFELFWIAQHAHEMTASLCLFTLSEDQANLDSSYRSWTWMTLVTAPRQTSYSSLSLYKARSRDIWSFSTVTVSTTEGRGVQCVFPFSINVSNCFWCSDLMLPCEYGKTKSLMGFSPVQIELHRQCSSIVRKHIW